MEFLKGAIEQIPLPAGSVDVVISNCVINLSTDKPAVLARDSASCGRAGASAISDVVAEDRLPPAERAERGSYVGCIAGALSKAEYEAGLEAAGFEDDLRRVHAPGRRRDARRDRQGRRSALSNVLFVCVANARPVGDGRAAVPSAGRGPPRRTFGRQRRLATSPHPQVVEALAEVGIDAAGHVPRALDAESLAWADLAVSTCSEEVCPVTPGVRRIRWSSQIRKDLPLEGVRPIRDEVARRVAELVDELDTPPR